MYLDATEYSWSVTSASWPDSTILGDLYETYIKGDARFGRKFAEYANLLTYYLDALESNKSLVYTKHSKIS